MKVILKNSGLVFQKQEQTPPTPSETIIDTAQLCGTSGLYKTDVVPLVLTASNNWGHSAFIPVENLVEINVACDSNNKCPGILYFSAEDISTYLGFEANTGSSLGMKQFTTFNPQSGAQYAIIQSYIAGGYYTPGSTCTILT